MPCDSQCSLSHAKHGQTEEYHEEAAKGRVPADQLSAGCCCPLYQSIGPCTLWKVEERNCGSPIIFL
jgi:hypothetical protein